MKNILIAAAVCLMVVFVGLNTASAQTTTTTTTSTSTSTSSTSTTSTTLICSDGSLACDLQCSGTTYPNTAVCTGGHSGLNFSGICVGAAGSNTCKYQHCGFASQICVGGPWTTIGCAKDAECASGEACVSSLGKAGCGTGYSQCVSTCTH